MSDWMELLECKSTTRIDAARAKCREMGVEV